jgi:hypothetical protein
MVARIDQLPIPHKLLAVLQMGDLGFAGLQQRQAPIAVEGSGLGAGAQIVPGVANLLCPNLMPNRVVGNPKEASEAARHQPQQNKQLRCHRDDLKKINNNVASLFAKHAPHKQR